MRHLDLFSGIGGFSLAASWVWGDDLEIICFCEIDHFCRLVLKKHWPTVPIVEDVNDLDRIVAYAKSNGRGRGMSRADMEQHGYQSAQCHRGQRETTIDLITGGVPCQPSSCAGKRKGKEDARWLWPQALAVVDAVKPHWVIFENPTGFLTLDGGVEYLKVLAHLEAQGYWTESFIIPASAVGAPHRRDRVWIVAESNAFGCGRGQDHQRQQATGRNGDQGAVVMHPEGEPIGTGLCQDGQTGKRWKRPGDADSDDSNAGCSMLEVGSGAEGERTHPATGSGYGHAPDRDGPRLIGSCGELSQDEDASRGNDIGDGNPAVWDEHWYEAAARLCRVDDGISSRVDGIGEVSPQSENKSKAAGRVHRLKAIGNSIVPQVAAQIMWAIKIASQFTMKG